MNLALRGGARGVIGSSISGFLVGLLYALMRGPHDNDPVKAGIAGLLITVDIYLVDRALESTTIGRWIRRRPLYVTILIEFAAFLAMVLLTLDVVGRLLDGRTYVSGTSIIYSLVISLALGISLRATRLIGGRVLLNVVIGRYNRPVREERVFLFIDLVGSTSIAERLGELETQALLSQFFSDLSDPIVRHRGEIYQYRGDEISISWPLASAIRDAAPIACAATIRRTIAARGEAYRARFGLVPSFRMGLHGGAVAAGEVGDAKREVVFFGDTVNTAARLLQVAKEHQVAACISNDLLTLFKLPEGARAEPLGPISLHGKHQPVEVFSLSFDPAPSRKPAAAAPYVTAAAPPR